MAQKIYEVRINGVLRGVLEGEDDQAALQFAANNRGSLHDRVDVRERLDDARRVGDAVFAACVPLESDVTKKSGGSLAKAYAQAQAAYTEAFAKMQKASEDADAEGAKLLELDPESIAFKEGQARSLGKRIKLTEIELTIPGKLLPLSVATDAVQTAAGHPLAVKADLGTLRDDLVALDKEREGLRAALLAIDAKETDRIALAQRASAELAVERRAGGYAPPVPLPAFAEGQSPLGVVLRRLQEGPMQPDGGVTVELFKLREDEEKALAALELARAEEAARRARIDAAREDREALAEANARRLKEMAEEETEMQRLANASRERLGAA